MVGFDFEGEPWSSEPRTAFYDWLYLTALQANTNEARQLLSFRAFTDIEFNPKRSVNCQARSCALFVALTDLGDIAAVLADREAYRHSVAPADSLW